MDRRNFICFSGALGLLCLTPKAALGRLVCGPFMPPGIQGCSAGIDSKIIDIAAGTVDGQHMSQWCWAACIEMVFMYYGLRVPQQQIVKEAWGDIVNRPGSPEQVLMSLNRRWTDTSGQEFTVDGDAYTANHMTAAQDLANDMPLMVGTMGHAMVLTRLDYNRDSYGGGEVVLATVRDPWPGKGRRTLTPQEWYNINFAARIRVVKM